MADTSQREQDDWADLPAQESATLAAGPMPERLRSVALAAAVLQRALAQPRLAGEVVRWAYPCDADHRRTTRISLARDDLESTQISTQNPYSVNPEI